MAKKYFRCCIFVKSAIASFQQELYWHTVTSSQAGGPEGTLLVAAGTAAATAATPNFGWNCVTEERLWCPCCSRSNTGTQRGVLRTRRKNTSNTKLLLCTCGRFVTLLVEENLNKAQDLVDFFSLNVPRWTRSILAWTEYWTKPPLHQPTATPMRETWFSVRSWSRDTTWWSRASTSLELKLAFSSGFSPPPQQPSGSKKTKNKTLL